MLPKEIVLCPNIMTKNILNLKLLHQIQLQINNEGYKPMAGTIKGKTNRLNAGKQ